MDFPILIMKKRFIKNKKGQEVLGLSFGIIFSIILIVFFIVIAGIVIKSFLGAQDCARLGIFIDRLEKDVDKSWNSPSDSHTFKGDLPSKIDYICFGNLTEASKGEFKDIGYELGLFKGKSATMFFYPSGKACEMPFYNLRHIDLEKITSIKNPNCFEIKRKKISFQIEKGFNDRFVNIK